MKVLINNLFILCFISSQIVYSQSSDTLLRDSLNRVAAIQTLPEFPGGKEAMYKLISDNLVYPEDALVMRVGGKVLVRFVVDTLGNATEINIIEGVRQDIDAEAIRLVGLLNGWIPGTQNGKKVKVIYKLPITFAPDRKWRKEYEKSKSK